MQHTSLGGLVLQPWLTEHGISYSLAQRYVQSGWLCKYAHGVYYRPDPRRNNAPDWVDALQALIEQLRLPIHLAGLSSLTHQGLSHYLTTENDQIWLGLPSRQALPKWCQEWPNIRWIYCRNSKLTFEPKDITTVTVEKRDLSASTPELAVYELIECIGKHSHFESISALFEGLVHLSPRKVQSLLERSRSVQTNRIFLFLGHYYQHPWVQRLDESRIHLGSGKRQVVAEGHLAARYQITVPQSFHKKHV